VSEEFPFIVQPNFDAVFLGLSQMLSPLSTLRELNSELAVIQQLEQALRMKPQKCK
jgi:hypothetical protein